MGDNLLFLGLGSPWVAHKLPTLVSRLGPTFILDATIILCVAFYAAPFTHRSLTAILSDVTFTSTIKTTHNLSYLSELIYLPCTGARKFLTASTLISRMAQFTAFMTS